MQKKGINPLLLHVMHILYSVKILPEEGYQYTSCDSRTDNTGNIA